jgi:DNA ligase-1
MRAFGELFESLDTTTSTNEKLVALTRYFRTAPAADAAWAVYFLSGRRLKRLVGGATLRQWLLLATGLPEWLLEETYSQVGDLAETIALLIDANSIEQHDLSLVQWIERLLSLKDLSEGERRELVANWWRTLDARGCFLLNKLLTGELRVGVSSGLVERALAEFTGHTRSVIAHRLMGAWQPTPEFWDFLIGDDDGAGDRSRPYPFCLASPLENEPAELGAPEQWLAEWKWDGIRAQILRRAGGVHIWTRGEELITERFPEIVQHAQRLPMDTVIDGEIVAWRDEQVRPFGELQQRIGRKKLSAKILSETPAHLIAYDLLEENGQDIRSLPLCERRSRLERLLGNKDWATISPRVEASTWQELSGLRGSARSRSVEGLMLKRMDSSYGTGRQRGVWWKWKIEPYSFDGVLVYAQPGHGRRANLLTDYTFAVRDGDNLVAVAKAYSGLTDKEIVSVDRWIRQNTVERFGPVRAVKPELVFEIAFDAINESTRHKSGVAVRFPRIARWRSDKPASEADTLDTLRTLLRTHPEPTQVELSA